MPQSSFLPEDYVTERAERRSSFISLVLFVVVMLGVLAAFFVTNRQWSIVRVEQQRINAEYGEAAKKIEELNQLEAQKRKLLEKAEIAQALVERVPRSILLAEFVNRMPDAVSMEKFELTSKLVRAVAPRVTGGKVNSLSNSTANQQATKAEEATERKIEVPKYDVTLRITGIAPTDVHVSDYLTSLNQCALLTDVELKFSKERDVDDQVMREFEMEMKLAPNADAKHFEPLKYSRSMRNPMLEGSGTIETFDRALLEVELEDESPELDPGDVSDEDPAEESGDMSGESASEASDASADDTSEQTTDDGSGELTEETSDETPGDASDPTSDGTSGDNSNEDERR